MTHSAFLLVIIVCSPREVKHRLNTTSPPVARRGRGRERTGLVRRRERQWATGTPPHGLGSGTRREPEQRSAGGDLPDRGCRGSPRGLGGARTGGAASRDPRGRRRAGHAPARGHADCGAAGGGVGAGGSA